MKQTSVADIILGKPKKKRKAVPQSKRTKVFVRCKGKCERCNGALKDLKPDIHHKDGNARNNIPSNLEVLCPNCHSKTRSYRKQKKSSTKEVGFFGVKSTFF